MPIAPCVLRATLTHLPSNSHATDRAVSKARSMPSTLVPLPCACAALPPPRPSTYSKTGFSHAFAERMSTSSSGTAAKQATRPAAVEKARTAIPDCFRTCKEKHRHSLQVGTLTFGAVME